MQNYSGASWREDGADRRSKIMISQIGLETTRHKQMLIWAFLVSPFGLPSDFKKNICAENALELMTLLSLPYKCWDYKHVLPCLAYSLFSYRQIK